MASAIEPKQRVQFSKPAETIQNTSGLLTAQDNEFHGSASFYVWETQGLAK